MLPELRLARLTSGQQEPQVERWVARLAEDLEKAGHDVILDQTHNEHFGKDVTRFIELIPKCDRVLVVGTPLYLQKYENEGFKKGTVVAAEMHLVNQRLTGTEAERETVIGLLLSGEEKTSFPPMLRSRYFADFRNEDDYFAVAFDLMLTPVRHQLPPARHRRMAPAAARRAVGTCFMASPDRGSRSWPGCLARAKCFLDTSTLPIARSRSGCSISTVWPAAIS